MDSFVRRLKYYGIGFMIGLLFVFIFFQNRGCSWLPSNRVKNSFLDRVIVVPEDQEPILAAKGLTKEVVIAVLNDGSVDFDKSSKQSDPKVYYLDKEFDKKGTVHFFFTLPSESFLCEVHLKEGSAKAIKNSTKGYGKIIHFPKDDNLVYVDSTSLVTCQQSVLGLVNPLDIYKLMQKSGKVDFSKTNYGLRPKVEQYIEFTDKKKRTIGAKAIWYKNKINITSFELPFESECK
jgi:hypothetical protein